MYGMKRRSVNNHSRSLVEVPPLRALVKPPSAVVVVVLLMIGFLCRNGAYGWPLTTTTRRVASSSLSASSSSSTTTATTATSTTIVEHMLYRIQQMNQRPDPHWEKMYYDFVVDDVVLGKVTPDKAQLLCQAQPNVFCCPTNNSKRLTLSTHIAPTCQARTAAVATVMETLRNDADNTPNLAKQWRNEMYPIAARFGEPPKLLVERATVPWLGAWEYGVHINGMLPAPATATDTSIPRLWMARRSATKPTYPGMVDHMVAGGQPAGLSVWDNAVKECEEEAGVSPDLAQAGLRPVGAVSYATPRTSDQCWTRAVLFIYDLHLPADFAPTVVDGEVQEFFTYSVDDMFQSLPADTDDPMKPNCYLVLIDWLLRHGHVSPDTPGYLEVWQGLRSGWN